MVTQRREDGDEVTRELLYPYFELHRVDWRDGDDRGTEFNLPISERLLLFDSVGFDVVEFHEVQNPDPKGRKRFGVEPQWGHEFPSEQAWRLRKR